MLKARMGFGDFQDGIQYPLFSVLSLVDETELTTGLGVTVCIPVYLGLAPSIQLANLVSVEICCDSSEKYSLERFVAIPEICQKEYCIQLTFRVEDQLQSMFPKAVVPQLAVVMSFRG